MKVERDDYYSWRGRVFKVRQTLEVVEIMSDGVEIPANARDMTPEERDEVALCVVKFGKRVREEK
jgi:hypothetical protein